MKLFSKTVLSFSLFVFLGQSILSGEVVDSAPDGFQIKVTIETNAKPARAFQKLTAGYSRWWDPNHSYSGKAENLKMDFEKGCIYEKLDQGGFVRHMEIVYCRPNKAIRLTGGLGPLQEIGVAGALTFKISEKNGKTQVELSYVANGYSKQNLDKIAPAVDKVLTDQMARLKKYCDQVREDD